MQLEIDSICIALYNTIVYKNFGVEEMNKRKNKNNKKVDYIDILLFIAPFLT